MLPLNIVGPMSEKHIQGWISWVCSQHPLCLHFKCKCPIQSTCLKYVLTTASIPWPWEAQDQCEKGAQWCHSAVPPRVTLAVISLRQ